jgi:crotonobetainyl-CoA:carnitine CoA-transferase CaiB-like acyl-CoA transferase
VVDTGAGRAVHADELDDAVGGWIAHHDLDDVLHAFEAADAAAAPVYDVSDVMHDPQYEALGTIVNVSSYDFGWLRMRNVMFRLLGTPGEVRWAGRRVGQDDDTVYAELGLSAAQIDQLRTAGTIASPLPVAGISARP